jgi:hypothetical protein
MNQQQAIAAAHRLAESMGVQLGEKVYGIGQSFPAEADDPSWTFLFAAPGCPAGWQWWVCVNDSGENQLLAAANRRPPTRPQPPCPYCGKPLKTDLAKQCLACGMDWHAPENVVRLGSPKLG